MPYAVRTLQPSDAEAVYSLYEQIGWEGTKQEWLHQITYGGDHSSVLTSDDKVVGAALSLSFESKVRIAGVIVDPAHRGKRLGEKIARHLLMQITEGASLELDATPSGKSLYEKFQFTETGQVITMTRSPSPVHSSSPLLCTEKELDQIESLDRAAFGASRRTFLERAFFQEHSPILISKKNQKITGFILCSELSKTQMRLGPWICEEAQEAKDLLHTAMNYSLGLGKNSLSIHVMKTHSAAMQILTALEFQLKEETTHMQSGPRIPTKHESYFAFWSLELG